MGNVRQGILKYFRSRFQEKNEPMQEEPMEVPESNAEEPKEYAVVIASYPIALWTPSVKETLAQESEHARLERELDTISKQIKFTEDGMLQMKKTLDAKFTGLVGELFVLRAELEAKFLESVEAQRNEGREESEEDNNGLSQDEAAELERIQGLVDSEEADRKKRRELREAELLKEATKLFRKISMLTHPDRTRDKNRHVLFAEARTALRKKNFQRLEDIWKILGGSKANPSNLLNALLSRISALRDQIREQQMKLSMLSNEVEHRMWRDYQRYENRPHVEAHYRQLLEYNIRQTRQILASMGIKKYASPMREEAESMPQESTGSNFKHQTSPEVDEYFKSHSVMQEKIEDELDSPWAEEEVHSPWPEDED